MFTNLSPPLVDLVTTARVGHLATVDERGQPHVVPVCFAVVAGRVYSPIDAKPKRAAPNQLRRLRNVAANPRVCLTVDRYDEDWRHLAWVQIRGKAHLVDAPAERDAAHAALRARYSQYREMDLESRPLLAIHPDRVVAWAADAASSESAV